MSDVDSLTTTGPLGQALDEYLLCCAGGEPPEREAFLGRFPDLAPSLARALDSLECFREAAPRLRLAVRDVIPGLAACSGPTLPRQIGDYVLHSELGRGGMGVVYEAEQRSLKRRVAIKILPLVAAIDAVSLQRFRVEAQIAACLHHPHIVPIYAVGVEEGIHFYAMQLIDGCSAAEWLRQRRAVGRTSRASEETSSSRCMDTPGRDPGWHRRVAELGVQAADALAYAHLCGVIHRDIKPANLLIESSGKLLITDFGVAFHAKMADMPPTLTGDILGTMPYLSPEQALGQHDRVDSRSDVYSLGVSLYELLTGARPFSSEDRLELLREITCDDPPPPRKWDASIPVDLETVLLKCLAKQPGERYASAKALGEDLQRFLDGRPLLARRPHVWERIRKWERRNRRLVRFTAAMMLLGLLAGVSISVRWIWQSYEEARIQRAKAADIAALVMDAADKTDDFAVQLWHVGGTGEAQREYFRTTADLMRHLADAPEATEEARWRAARALWRLGAVHGRAMDVPAAVAAYEEAVQRGEALVGDFPHRREYRVELGNFRYQLSTALTARLAPGDRERARELTEQAWRELEELARERPDESPLREYLLQVRAAIADRRFADRDYRGAIAALDRLKQTNELLAERYPDHPASYIRLNSNWQMLGRSYMALEESKEAQRCLLEAVRCDQRLKVLPLAKPTDRDQTWSAQGVLGELLLDQGELLEAEKHLLEITQDIEPLAQSMKEATWFRAIGLYFGCLGKLYFITGRRARAAEAFEKCESLFQGWPPQSPEFPPWVWLLALSPRLGPADYPDMTRHVEQLETHHPQHPLRPLSEALITLRCGNAPQAIQLLQDQLAEVDDSRTRCRIMYLLAWAHAELDQLTEARRLHNLAESLRLDHKIHDSDVELLSAELSEMLIPRRAADTEAR